MSDNGLGIEPTHHECVFELFHKLDPGGEGTGLGLALVRRIVETHGGRIWVESEGRGRGSTFCFTLPRGSETGLRAGRPPSARDPVPVRRSTSSSSKPSRLFHSVAQSSDGAVSSGTVIPSSLTRTPSVSVFTRSRSSAR